MASSGEDHTWDVIVIGAGIAGMTAAYRILQADQNARVLVLEAKDRVGGRTDTLEMNAALGKDVWDLGGQWVGRTQHHMLWLMEELGITKYPQYTAGRKVLRLSDDKIRSYTTSIPTLPLMSLIDLHRFMSAVDRMAKTVPIDDPRKAVYAEEWDSITLETLMRRLMWTQSAWDVTDAATCVVFGTKPRAISLLSHLHYFNSGGGVEALIDTKEDCANEYKITGGAMQICERLRDAVGEKNVLIGEPVTEIDQSDEDVVSVTTATGKNFRCRYIISAAPLHCSVDIDYIPHQPTVRASLALHSPVGHLFKFVISYKKAFWREKGYSGELVSTGGQPVLPGCTSGPLQLIYDASTPNGNPALVGFYANGREWSNKTEEECKGAVLNALAEIFGPEAKQPIDFKQKDWGKEPYNGGCPVNVMTPGAISYFYDGLTQPFDRIHWAGTESATIWRGYMSGAVQSGMRAADEVLDRLWPGLPRDNLLKELDDMRSDKTRQIPRWLSLSGAVAVGLLFSYAVRRYWLTL
ncbi:probable flavin-containing monoamine oxidase A isoform X2 [Amphiura filiformis]|uniref:probable flavin-containing monoamine oxidase A isoform X1 n=1 Tax=Amphiura filiformis TaxID=82378 RepID=UPI003B221FAA